MILWFVIFSALSFVYKVLYRQLLVYFTQLYLAIGPNFLEFSYIKLWKPKFIIFLQYCVCNLVITFFVYEVLSLEIAFQFSVHQQLKDSCQNILQILLGSYWSLCFDFLLYQTLKANFKNNSNIFLRFSFLAFLHVL